MDPKARAEARRQAILTKGSKRLAKLTSSARGEDSAVMHQDLPTEFGNRLTESPTPDPHIPAIPVHPPLVPSGLNEPFPHLERERMIRELFGAPLQAPSGSIPNLDHGLAPFLTSIIEGSALSPKSPSGSSVAVNISEPTSHQKQIIAHFLPLIRLASVIMLSIFFVSRYGPEQTGNSSWSTLKHHSPNLSQPAGLFQSFAALEIVWYALYMMCGLIDTTVPGIISAVLPLLSQPYTTGITTAVQYINMAQRIADDLAVALLITGFVVWNAGRMSQ
ncbi:uncharacterized protein EI90DRAFT_3290266 [Cantharellus anzutake]|uniref:uncharacterized protein n=1 Tax=Cantharellus anzutake TaxID=1750568 RepID=UPI0019084760|nr:uncharacterized protein EI90DRAFT_3290266 [Cantharellus anzutake]KAF8329092.1 hypothetical protein EI90DRAFT_3290266 [Cantharellus anzutake]